MYLNFRYGSYFYISRDMFAKFLRFIPETTYVERIQDPCTSKWLPHPKSVARESHESESVGPDSESVGPESVGPRIRTPPESVGPRTRP